MNTVVPFERYVAPSTPLARTPPANVEAEAALLGAVLLNNAAFQVVSAIVQAEHFSEEFHRRAWSVITMMVTAGQVANPITLKTFLGDHDLGDGVTVPRYLARLAADATTIVNAPDYARMVHDLAVRRELITISEEVANIAFDAPVGHSPRDQIDAALEQIRQVGDALPSVEQESTIAGALNELIRGAQENLDGKATTVPTSGLADLDRTIGGGLRPGRLIVLAGRPGAGKTVILTAIARRAAQKGAGVGLFSLEIDRPEFTARLTASALAGGSDPMDYRDILTGQITAGQVERLVAARSWLASLPLDVCDRGGLTMQQIETRAVTMGKRFARAGRKLDVVMIDYLQLVRVTDRYKGNVVNEYGEIALAAKNMAKRLDVCVVLLSQLSRGVEGRESKRPLLSDLRGSGNIEEHADAVGMLYRAAYYDKHDPKVLNGDPDAVERAKCREYALEVIWEKNRLGPTATDHFYCNVARSQVDSMSRHNMGGS